MNLNFNEICRLCLRFCDKYVDLNQTNGVKTLADDLIEKIKYCYYVQVDISEGFPTKVCYECIQVLSFFYTAKKNVIISDKLLRDILFVRQKMEQETDSYKEENVTLPDIIEFKQDEQKSKPVVVSKSNELKKSDENSPKAKNVELHYNSESVNTPQNGAIPTVQHEKEIIISFCDADEGHTSVKDKPHSKVKKKKKIEQLQESAASSDLIQNAESNNITELPTPPSSNLDLVLKFRDLKKGPGRRPKAIKDKTTLGDETPVKEYVFKEIGTVIDTNNILSPDVKRPRKSISAKVIEATLWQMLKDKL